MKLNFIRDYRAFGRIFKLIYLHYTLDFHSLSLIWDYPIACHNLMAREFGSLISNVIGFNQHGNRPRSSGGSFLYLHLICLTCSAIQISHWLTSVVSSSDPPKPVNPKVVDTRSDSIRIEWQVHDFSPIDGFVISFKSDLDDWSERTAMSKHSDYTLSGLKCGTKYQITVAAFNKAGRGDTSEPLLVSTAGSSKLTNYFLMAKLIIQLVELAALVLTCTHA